MIAYNVDKYFFSKIMIVHLTFATHGFFISNVALEDMPRFRT